MRISRLLKRLRRWSSQAFRKRHSPAAFRTCRNAGNSVLTAEGTASKGTGSISCEVEFCIFLRTHSQKFTDKGCRRYQSDYIHEETALALFCTLARQRVYPSKRDSPCFLSLTSQYICTCSYKLQLQSSIVSDNRSNCFNEIFLSPGFVTISSFQGFLLSY